MSAHTIELLIESITVDPDIQQRAAFNDALATEYSQTVLGWIESAPVTVFFDGKTIWLADGFHRIAAVKIAGGENIHCNLIKGNKRDAILYATGANDGHGLRRSHADKRKAVLTLLNDSDWAQRSDRWIADQAKVSHTFVSKARGQLATLPVESTEPAVEICGYPVHPAANIFPMLDQDQLNALADDIATNGQQVKIQLFEGQIIDGRNRAKACEIAGVEPQFENVTCENPYWHVWSLNGNRRSFNSDIQRGVTLLVCGQAAVNFESPDAPVDFIGGLIDETESTPAPVGNKIVAEVTSKFTGETESTPAPVINNSVNNGTVGRDGKTRGAKPTRWVTLDHWNTLTTQQQRNVLELTPRDLGAWNKQTGSGIQWAQWSWNPITGCRAGCSYCYAREIAESTKMSGICPGFEVALHPNRLDAPKSIGNAENNRVFVCSMSDLFGHWVPVEWINAVLSVIKNAKHLQFLLLTKFPKRLLEFDFPKNCWIGTTCDNQQRMDVATEVFKSINASVKWVSIEPMLEPIIPPDPSVFDWYVIGGASRTDKSEAFQPPYQWIAKLITAIGEQPYFLKENMDVHGFPTPMKRNSPAVANGAILETAQSTGSNGAA